MWRRSGAPQNFFLAFIDYLEKLMFIKKLLKQANQKQNNFNICNVWFKKRIKKNNCKYHYQNLDDMIYSSWDIEQKRLKKTALKKTKNQNFEKIKKTVGDIIILHTCTKNHDHMMHGSWDTELDRQNFLSLWTIFCPFTQLTTWKIKNLKK